jgi:hypothetical protein
LPDPVVLWRLSDAHRPRRPIVCLSQALASVPGPGLCPRPWPLSQALASVPGPGLCPRPWPLSQALAFLALSATLLSLVTSAHAGNWQLSVTGPKDPNSPSSGSAVGLVRGMTHTNVAWAPPTGPSTGSISLNSVATNAPVQNNPTENNGGAAVSATANLSVTINATWVGSPNSTVDPAPTSVIVTETSTATGFHTHTDSNDQPVNAVGSADDGLAQSDPQDPSTGTVSGTKYLAITPTVSGTTATFQVSLNLSASASDSSGPNGMGTDFDPFNGTAQANASVGPITITVTSLYVMRNGTRLTGGAMVKVLPGQNNNFTIDSGELTQSNWQWTASGDKFSDWIETGTQAVKYVNILYNRQSLVFYYTDGAHGTDGEQETVSCTLTVGDATHQTTATVSGYVNVVQPDTTIDTSWGGAIGFDPNASSPNSVGLFGTPYGINYTADVTIPGNLDQSAQYCFVQLISPRRWERVVVGDQTYEFSNALNACDPKALDERFPAWGPYYVQSGQQGGGDSPALTTNASSSGGIVTRAVTGIYLSPQEEQLTTYVMFKPAGDDSQWVPLMKFDWWWSVDAQNPDGWQLMTSDRYLGTPEETTDHPVWSQVASGGDLVQTYP